MNLEEAFAELLARPTKGLAPEDYEGVAADATRFPTAELLEALRTEYRLQPDGDLPLAASIATLALARRADDEVLARCRRLLGSAEVQDRFVASRILVQWTFEDDGDLLRDQVRALLAQVARDDERDDLRALAVNHHWTQTLEGGDLAFLLPFLDDPSADVREAAVKGLFWRFSGEAPTRDALAELEAPILRVLERGEPECLWSVVYDVQELGLLPHLSAAVVDALRGLRERDIDELLRDDLDELFGESSADGD